MTEQNRSGLPQLPASSLPEIATVGTELIVKGDADITPEQQQRLTQPIDVAQLDVTPTGDVYASQVFYRRLLNEVFGPGRWGVVELSQPKVNNKTVIEKFGLIVGGKLLATAWGSCDYEETNARMDWTDALEGAKSDGLKRCCKDLGIAAEVWDRRFTSAFLKEHCVKVKLKGRDKPAWRRIDQEPAWNDERLWDRTEDERVKSYGSRSAMDGRGGAPDDKKRPPRKNADATKGKGATAPAQTGGAAAKGTPPPAVDRPTFSRDEPKMTAEDRRGFFAVGRRAGHDDDEILNWVKAVWGLESSKDLPARFVPDVRQRLELDAKTYPLFIDGKPTAINPPREAEVVTD